MQSSQILQKCIALLQNNATSILKLKQIHAYSINHGILLTNPDMGKHLIYTLISLDMLYARKVFSLLRNPPNVFIWNTMIRGYAESDETPFPVIQLYREMQTLCIEPDSHTYPFIFKGLNKLLDVKLGEMMHCVVLKNGFESLVFVKNCLLHFYAACGRVETAYKVFESMPERDVVGWNSVINGFAMNGRPNEALTLYREMSLTGVDPDSFTIVSLLSACTELGALALGRRVHVYILKDGWSENLQANNGLLDLYAKCGSISETKKVFDEMKGKNVVSWTSLIVGLAVNGFGKEALDHFMEMEKQEIVPGEITFVGVLYACSHCGMVNEGFDYFQKMQEKYGIKPRIEHYGCMVDLLCRSGKIEEAYNYIKKMPLLPNAVIWRTLLGACTVHGNVTLGEIARAQISKLEPRESGDYVLLSNLYASEQRWSDVHQLRRTMLKQGIKKIPGFSLVELGNCFYEFVMGDRSHPQAEQIYEKLMEITKKLRLEGYVPRTEYVLADIDEEEKEHALSYHSEKIAVAFMLLNTSPGTSIRIMKNLRVCADCHLAFKLISKVYDREIIVRDRSRFHHFKNGTCSCKDYW